MEKKVIKNWRCDKESELQLIASDLMRLVKKPCAVVLTGAVGAGKTTFSKYFSKMLSPSNDELASSPSYSIINEMDDFIHADFFRIKNVSEIVHLEIPLYIEGKHYFFIEWGIDWLNEIRKELNSEFSVYELEICIAKKEKKLKSDERIFTLYDLN